MRINKFKEYIENHEPLDTIYSAVNVKNSGSEVFLDFGGGITLSLSKGVLSDGRMSEKISNYKLIKIKEILEMRAF